MTIVTPIEQNFSEESDEKEGDENRFDRIHSPNPEDNHEHRNHHNESQIIHQAEKSLTENLKVVRTDQVFSDFLGGPGLALSRQHVGGKKTEKVRCCTN